MCLHLLCGKRPQTLFHYGPVITVLLISGISTNTLGVLNNLERTSGEDWNHVRVPFIFIVIGICVCYFTSVFCGGGKFPKNWRPKSKEDEKYLQYCHVCEGFKPPRSHHCHECGTCVPKLDHHCPWINSCVGNRNHVQFVGFVTLAPLGCFIAACIQGYFLYKYKPPMGHLAIFAKYQPDKFFYLAVTLFSFAFAVAVTLAVGGLMTYQYICVWYNQTQIEGWIMEKAERRQRSEPFVFPYDLGPVQNFKEWFMKWYNGDGIEWTVAKGCDQYTFTREQLAQKAAKRERTRTILLDKNVGKCYGCEYGVRVWWNGPGCMEPHAPGKVGDLFKVWNYGDEWYYGEKVVETNGKLKAAKPRQRGWLPGNAIGDMLPKGALSVADAQRMRQNGDKDE